MSETQETPQKIDQVASEETEEERKLNFKEFYPVNELLGYVGINIGSETGNLWCLANAGSSPAWVQLNVAGPHKLEGKSASGSSEAFVPCAAVVSLIRREAIVQEAP